MKKLKLMILPLSMAVLMAACSPTDNNSTTTVETTTETTTDSVTTEAAKLEETKPVKTETKAPATEAIKEPLPDLTMGQKNALASAKSYLNALAFSHSGLIKQLEFEGYSTEDATYAADNCGADWNEQAAKSAQSYIDSMAFSRDGLIKQLEFEGYTTEQAEFGVTAVGY